MKKILIFLIIPFIVLSPIFPLISFSRFNEGNTVQDFLASDLAGKKTPFSTYVKDNKLIALFFWKTPEEVSLRNYSEEEMVLLQKLYTGYKNYGFEIIGLYCPWGDENPGLEEMAKLKEALKKNNITFPVLIDYRLEIYNKFGVSALPSIILLNNKSVSEYLLAGYPPFAEKSLKQKIETSLNIQSDQKIDTETSLYALKSKAPGQFKYNFISDRLWGEKLILSFYGKSGNIGLNNPTSFAIGENGQIYIVDSLNSVVKVFDLYGKYLFNFGHDGFGGENLALPWGIAVDNKGRIFVSDIGNNLIYVYDSNGKFLVKFGGDGKKEGQFNMPFDITVDSQNNIFIVDSQNDRVQVINGKFKFKIGTSGSKDGEFSLPTAIALSRDENSIFVVDTNNSRVQVFDKRGNFIRKFGRPGSRKGEFNHPEGIAVDMEGKVFVSDTLNNRIQIFDEQGNFLGMFGNLGSGDGEFNSPSKSFTDMKGRFYVVDRKNNRIQGFNLNYLHTFL